MKTKCKIVECEGEYYIPLKYFPWAMYPELMAKGVYTFKGDRYTYVKLKDALPEIVELIGEEETQKFLNRMRVHEDLREVHENLRKEIVEELLKHNILVEPDVVDFIIERGIDDYLLYVFKEYRSSGVVTLSSLKKRLGGERNGK